jgi:hypothetical protein
MTLETWTTQVGTERACMGRGGGMGLRIGQTGDRGPDELKTGLWVERWVKTGIHTWI